VVLRLQADTDSSIVRWNRPPLRRNTGLTLSRRGLLCGTAAAVTVATSPSGAASPAAHYPYDSAEEILGQGDFRYRVHRLWGRLDRQKYPVRDGHGITGDRNGRIVLLTNEIKNNLIAYDKTGKLSAAWEHRFPGAHGLDIIERDGEEQYWITDRSRQLIFVCTADGRQLLQVGPDALRAKYPDISKYHPTNTAALSDGTFFVSDGYGSSFIHHFDPTGRYITSFGGEGEGPEHLKTPHSVWVDERSGKPQLLVCDRGHNTLKWFSTSGELLRILTFGPLLADDESISLWPANVAPFGTHSGARFADHIAVACLAGMILILDGKDQVVSAVGGLPPVYIDGHLEQLIPFNYAFNHPHDVYVDSFGDLYVSQWWSNRTYPIKLELTGSA
jgi:peptidylamidoglycolate lyase